jgi:hypothetical protein
MDDYTKLFEEATEHARRAYWSDGRMAKTVSSEWLYRVRDALQDLVAENTGQRSRIAALEATVGQIRAVRSRRKTWHGLSLQEEAELDAILDAAPSTVLDQMIREAKAEAWDEGWSAGNAYALETPTRGETGDWANPYRNGDV